MTIAIYIRSSENDPSSANHAYEQIFSILAAKYTMYQFVFISDRLFPQHKFQGSNIKTVIMPPRIRNRLLQHYWFNYKIPQFLEKINASLFISNAFACSLRTGVKQCMILEGLAFLGKNKVIKPVDNSYNRKNFSKFIKKASCIAVTHPYAVTTLESIYPGAKGKSRCIGFGIDESSVKFDGEKLQTTKDKITDGREYFLAFISNASLENTLILLKAFSLFKKRQMSNMQLVLLVTTTQKEVPVNNLENYKYRNEVKVIFPENREELLNLTAAAYTGVYLPSNAENDNQCMLAMFNKVPLITSDTDFNKAIYEDAVLYSSLEEKKLSETMMLLYKDENLRNDLILKGNTLAAGYTWEATAAKLWGFLQESAVQTA